MDLARESGSQAVATTCLRTGLEMARWIAITMEIILACNTSPAYARRANESVLMSLSFRMWPETLTCECACA